MILMQQVYLKFDEVEQVRKFISTIEKIDTDFNLGRGSRTVDAKSVIGVFGLDLNQPQLLTFDSDDKTILEKISPYLAIAE